MDSSGTAFEVGLSSVLVLFSVFGDVSSNKKRDINWIFSN